jgi:hypothetical protein
MVLSCAVDVDCGVRLCGVSIKTVVGMAFCAVSSRCQEGADLSGILRINRSWCIRRVVRNAEVCYDEPGRIVEGKIFGDGRRPVPPTTENTWRIIKEGPLYCLLLATAVTAYGCLSMPMGVSSHQTPRRVHL